MIQHNYPAIWLKIYTLPTGRILAIAELTECWKSLDGKLIEAQSPGEKRVRFADTHELYFGDFTPGRYAWELTNVRRLPEPIPARGRQGLWNWEPHDDWKCVVCKEFVVGGGLCEDCIEQETETAVDLGLI